MSTITAPRTPETSRIFDCLNDANNSAKLSNDVALNSLKQAQSAYDAAIDSLDVIEKDVSQKREQVAAKESDVKFLKLQLENARKRTPVLELRFKTENDKATACNAEPSPCTIAEKQIHVLTSNNASLALIENTREINQYIEDIATAESTLETMETNLKNIEAARQPEIVAAEKVVSEAQSKFVGAKEKQDKTQKDFDELHDACKIAEFHKNQASLDELRIELGKYGVNIKLADPVIDSDSVVIDGAPDDDKPEFVNTDNYDCRYKPVAPCQGANLELSNASQRELCRQQIDPQCFAKTYETYWVLDFWSFIFIAPAIAACIFEEDFSYGLCVGSSAYVLALKYLGNEMGIPY